MMKFMLIMMYFRCDISVVIVVFGTEEAMRQRCVYTTQPRQDASCIYRCCLWGWMHCWLCVYAAAPFCIHVCPYRSLCRSDALFWRLYQYNPIQHNNEYEYDVQRQYDHDPTHGFVLHICHDCDCDCDWSLCHFSSCSCTCSCSCLSSWLLPVGYTYTDRIVCCYYPAVARPPASTMSPPPQACALSNQQVRTNEHFEYLKWSFRVFKMILFCARMNERTMFSQEFIHLYWTVSDYSIEMTTHSCRQ